MVRPKKHLGQHFLKDENIALKISESLTGFGGYKHVVEIGPGTGALTKHLLKTKYHLATVETDHESVAYLREHFPELTVKAANFLKEDLSQFPSPFAIAGNFPYNISSQILFRIYENYHLIPESVGMFQKEVAERIAEKEGTKKYGILSVLIQTFYDVEYLFTVSEDVFYPPPNVKSAVLRLQRNNRTDLSIPQKFYTHVVKTAFNQRRKTLRNSLKSFEGSEDLDPELTKLRPEQLSVDEFLLLASRLHSLSGK